MQANATAAPLCGRKLVKRHHDKSRRGCVACKRRRVKCDEAWPSCAACVAFCLPCEYANGVPELLQADRATSNAVHGADSSMSSSSSVLRQRKGRGRPRKNWAASLNLSQPDLAPPGPASRPDLFSYVVSPGTYLSQYGLLNHFTTRSGPALVGSDNPQHPMILFWQCEAPKLAFIHQAIFHLLLSLAAFHIRHLLIRQGQLEQISVSEKVARHHLSIGIFQFNTALNAMNNTTCGPILVSSMVLCFCVFAAGPSGPGDLLICDLETANTGGILPLIRGLRFIENSFDPNILYAGVMRSFSPDIAGSLDDPRPSCVCLGYPQVNWHEQLLELRHVITQNGSHNTSTYLSSYKTLTKIYEAAYGDKDGFVRCPTYYKAVLIFLYLADDQFISCVYNGEVIALLIFAYYAPLLKVDPNAWYLLDWAGHIVQAVRKKIGLKYQHLLVWPMKLVS